MIRAIILGATVLAAHSATTAAEPSPSTTIFGMEAGKPLQLPKCDGYLAKVVCQRSANVRGSPWEEFFVNFPADQVPEIAASLTMSVRTVGGNIVGYRFETIGFRGQDQTIKLLSDKFGKPTSVVYQDMGTLAGGSFKAAVATWEFSDLSIRFDSLGYGTRAGRVEIFTPEGAALDRQQDDAENKKRVPL